MGLTRPVRAIQHLHIHFSFFNFRLFTRWTVFVIRNAKSCKCLQKFRLRDIFFRHSRLRYFLEKVPICRIFFFWGGGKSPPPPLRLFRMIRPLCTVQPRFNELLFNEVHGITNDFLQPGQNYSKMYGTEPPYNEILFITNTIQT